MNKKIIKFLVYFGRWQLSTLVMMPFMICLEQLGLNVSLNLIIAQCIGCLIFFPIDNLILNDKFRRSKISKIKNSILSYKLKSHKK